MTQRNRPTPSRFDPRSKKTDPEQNSPDRAQAVSRSGRPGRPARLPMPEDPEIARLARLAIDWPRVSLHALAEGCGSSVPSMSAYRGGGRRVPPEVLRRLAGWVRAHAQTGFDLAAEIDALADEVSQYYSTPKGR